MKSLFTLKNVLTLVGLAVIAGLANAGLIPPDAAFGIALIGNIAGNTAETLALIKAAQSSPNDDIAKSFAQSSTATSGLTFYDLEGPAKTLYPVLTPLRNRIPRVTGGKGIQANWRAVTGINSGGVFAGVSEGNRNAAIAHTTADYLAAFRFLGLDDYRSFESEMAAEGFDDVRSRMGEGLLRSTMIQEEFLDLGGNTSVALGTANTPTVADVTTGGTIGQTVAMRVFVVGLTLAAYQRVAGWNNGMTGQSLDVTTAALAPTISRVNMSGDTETIAGGVGQVSAVGAVTTATDGLTTHRITATVARKAGEVAYAWYWGTVGNELLGAITTINSVNITATATGAQNVSALPAADHSTDSLVYDGLLTQIMKSGSGAYVADLATGTPGTGTGLTSDGAGGCAEIETAFAAFWNLYRLSPDEMYMAGGVLTALNKLIIANGGAPLIRMNMDANGGHNISAGTVVGSYLNKITGKLVKVTVHPNMPAGMLMFFSDGVPYPVSNVGNIVQKRLRRDYYQIDWPITRRRYEAGVYFDGVLQNYFPPAFGVIRNINS